MIELQPQQFCNVLPLLTTVKQKVLPFAICQGNNPGRVFVDHCENPRLGLIWSPVGYYFLVGDLLEVEDISEISHVLTGIFVPASQIIGETGFILIPSTGKWKEHLPKLLPGRDLLEIYRRPFLFEVGQFAKLNNWQECIPTGFQVQKIDLALAEQVEVLTSWATINDFLKHGLGFAVLKGPEIISSCISVFASQDTLEIDLRTEEKYRRHGFATLVASAFIEGCLQSGKHPNWECFWDNEPSSSLAKKLGFKAETDYPVYYWEE